MDTDALFSVRVSTSTLDKLKAMAAAHYRSLSDEIRFLIDTHPAFKDFDPDSPKPIYQIKETAHVVRE